LNHARHYLRADRSLKRIAHSPFDVVPVPLVRAMTRCVPAIVEWINDARGGDLIRRKRFYVNTVYQDQYACSYGGRQCEFWEAEIDFDGQRKMAVSRKYQAWLTELGNVLFNGVCIRVPGVFAEARPSELIQVHDLSRGPWEAPALPEVHSGRSNGIMGWLWNRMRREAAISSFTANRTDFDVPVTFNPTLGDIDEDLQYVGVFGHDLYLLMHTDLSGNLFELDLFNPIVRNAETFQSDVRFIDARLRAVDPVLDLLADRPAISP